MNSLWLNLCIEILSQWVELSVLAKFDLALCSIKLRTNFLEIISSESFVFPNNLSRSNDHVLLWIGLRRIKLKYLYLIDNPSASLKSFMSVTEFIPTDRITLSSHHIIQ
jgi:hypothetical protein